MMSQIIVDNKFTLHYKIVGQGHPTLIIGSSVYYPRTFSSILEQHLQLIYMDHRGFSLTNSSILPSDFELEKLIADIEQLRQHLQIASWNIIGHSGHGYIALEYAKKYSQYTSSLILIALSPDSSHQSFLAADQYLQDSVCPERKQLLQFKMQQLPALIQENPAGRFITYSLCSGPRIWFDYNYDAQNLWKDVHVIPEMFDYVWGDIFKKLDITVNLSSMEIPVFLALGRYDYWNPPFLWNSIRSKFQDLTVAIFEKSGHTPQFEEAESFNYELLSWLEHKCKNQGNNNG